MSLCLIFLVPLIGALLLLIILFFLFGPGHEMINTRQYVPLSEEEQLFDKEYHQEKAFVSCFRQNKQLVKIFRRKCFAIPETKAVVIFAHGLNDHTGRALPYIKNLLNHGFSVYAQDCEGFGRSDGRHGFISDFYHLVSDFQDLIVTAKKDFPEKKIFLLGGSMGGLLILSCVLEMSNSKDINGAVIQCPVIEIHTSSRPSKTVERVAKFLNTIAPKLPFSKAHRGLSNSPSVAASIQKEKEADELFYLGKLRIGTGLTMINAVDQLQTRLQEFNIPYLLQHGASDQVCTISGSRKFHEANQSKDKSFIEYANAAHDLLREPKVISTKVERDYIAWLEKRC